MSLTPADETAPNYLPCSGCRKWHMRENLKTFNARLWCVLCYPGAVT